jgi:hypothetical protein
VGDNHVASPKYSINRTANNWSISCLTIVAYCRTDITYCCINKSKFLITWLETRKHLAFLTHFLSRILGHNSKYRWGNVKGMITCDNY